MSSSFTVMIVDILGQPMDSKTVPVADLMDATDALNDWLEFSEFDQETVELTRRTWNERLDSDDCPCGSAECGNIAIEIHDLLFSMVYAYIPQ